MPNVAAIVSSRGLPDKHVIVGVVQDVRSEPRLDARSSP